MGIALKVRYIVSFHNNEPAIIENGIILVDGNKISAIGKDIEIKDRELLEFNHHIVISGLVNTHSHVSMTLFRGYADDIPLNTWLNDYIWPMELKLTGDQTEAGAKLAAIELIMSGTTTVNSMYWHPDKELKAFKELGVRIIAGSPIISGVTDLKSSEQLIKNWHGKNDDMSRISINPHAPYTVTSEDYQKILDYKNAYNDKNNTPRLKVHTHLAESRIEMDLIKKFTESNGNQIPGDISTPIEYLNSTNVLDEDLIAAHVVECTDSDINLLKANQVGVSINTVSNLKLGNGIARLNAMNSQNLNIGIGTDGPASNNGFDLFETMKLSAILQKSTTHDPSILSAAQILKMATIGGAKVLGWDDIGAILPGYKADLTFINLKTPHLKPIISKRSLISLLVYSVNQRDVSDVMINGIWKMRNRELIGIDTEKIMTKFDNCIQELYSS